MALERQNKTSELVRKVLGGRVLQSPAWLNRPGRIECRRRWVLVKRIYHELTGLQLPDEMPPRERRDVDLVLQRKGEEPRIIEFDETQHFNRYRALTIRAYPRSVKVGFDKRRWLAASEAKNKLEGGGFGVPRPPLFPGDGGRHRQRAFRDALCDIVPPSHGWLPTLRIADFEVEEWLWERSARSRMAELLEARGLLGS